MGVKNTFQHLRFCVTLCTCAYALSSIFCTIPLFRATYLVDTPTTSHNEVLHAHLQILNLILSQSRTTQQSFSGVLTLVAWRAGRRSTRPLARRRSPTWQACAQFTEKYGFF